MSKNILESKTQGFSNRMKNIPDLSLTNVVTEAFSPTRKAIKAFMSDEERLVRVKNATDNLNEKIRARKKAWEEMQTYFYTNTDNGDFLSDASRSAEATQKNLDLQLAYREAENAEKKARQELWSAKYDTMTDRELQDVVASIKDKKEKAYVTTLQETRVKDSRKKELEDMNAVSDPESVLYDPDFETKSAYQSTKLPDGNPGESDTGYDDIDYEFINGNTDISELIVGMDRNYYYITDQEKKNYNYWHTYDQEHGTKKAKRYLNLLQETLNVRDSEADYAKIKGKTLRELAFAGKTAWSSYGNDVNNGYLMSGDYIPMTSTEITAQKAREGLADVGDFIKINGSSLGQLIFDGNEAFHRFLAPATVGLVTLPYSATVGALMGAIFTGLEEGGKKYKERVNRGYPAEQAKKYATLTGINAGASSLLADEANDKIEKFFDKVILDEEIKALGKLLVNNDWLGVTDAIKAKIQEYIEKLVTGEEKPDEEELEKAVRSEVTAKAMDKIFNRMGADPENISADLRKPILQSLQDPAIRQRIEKMGTFSSDRLDEITAGLINAGDRDEGIGTYVGDILYGPTGFAMNKQALIPLEEEIFRNRDMYYDNPTGRALYLRYKR